MPFWFSREILQWFVRAQRMWRVFFCLSISLILMLSTSHFWMLNERRELSVPLSCSFCRLTGIKLHISKSDEEPSEHFGSSLRYGGNGGGGILKSGGATNPHSMSQSNFKSMSNFFHITLGAYFSREFFTFDYSAKKIENSRLIHNFSPTSLVSDDFANSQIFDFFSQEIFYFLSFLKNFKLWHFSFL